MREAQYNVLLGQASEAATLRSQYALLLAQFTALGAVAAASSDSDRKKVDVSVTPTDSCVISVIVVLLTYFGALCRSEYDVS